MNPGVPQGNLVAEGTTLRRLFENGEARIVFNSYGFIRECVFDTLR